jgi:hypothetical protein
MTEQQLHKLLEVQYLKGRLDELEYKAKPNVIDLHRSRKLDARIQKYYDKLKNTSEEAYHLHLVEKANVQASKRKSQEKMKELLTGVKELISDEEYIKLINKQLDAYV